MSRYTTPAHAPSTTRRIAAALLLVPALGAAAACSSEAPVTADVTATTPAAGTTAPTPTGTATASPTTTATTAPTSAAPKRTDTTLNVKVKDDVLGHVVTVKKLSRNIPFPGGHPVAADTFEIVGLEVTLDAGDRYSAPLEPKQLFLEVGKVSIPATTEFGKALPAQVKKAERGKVTKGWLFFKVDKGAGDLTLQLKRPAYSVSTTDKSIPAKTFEVKLVPAKK